MHFLQLQLHMDKYGEVLLLLSFVFVVIAVTAAVASAIDVWLVVGI